jgi:hypothetical protein
VNKAKLVKYESITTKTMNDQNAQIKSSEDTFWLDRTNQKLNYEMYIKSTKWVTTI